MLFSRRWNLYLPELFSRLRESSTSNGDWSAAPECGRPIHCREIDFRNLIFLESQSRREKANCFPVRTLVRDRQVQHVFVLTRSLKQCFLDIVPDRKLGKNSCKRLIEDGIHHGQETEKKKIVRVSCHAGKRSEQLAETPPHQRHSH